MSWSSCLYMGLCRHHVGNVSSQHSHVISHRVNLSSSQIAPQPFRVVCPVLTGLHTDPAARPILFFHPFDAKPVLLVCLIYVFGFSSILLAVRFVTAAFIL